MGIGVVSPEARSQGHDGVQGAGRRRQRQGRRFPVQEEQDRRLSRRRRASPRPAKSRSRAPTARRKRWKRNPSSSPPAPTSRGSKASRSTKSASCRRPARLSLAEVPKHLLVVGAGVIGLELGSVWRRLGAQVTVVEFLDGVLPGMDGEVRRQAQRIARKAGHDVQAVVEGDGGRRVRQDGLKATVEPAKGGAAETIEADVVLVAIGRVPYTEGLGLNEIGVKLDERGRVVVDHYYRDQRSRHLGDRRRHRRADAGAQGRGRRRRGRGNSGRAGRPRELRRHPECRLHLSGNRHGRQNRRGVESSRRRLQRRQVSVHRQRPRQGRT